MIHNQSSNISKKYCLNCQQFLGSSSLKNHDLSHQFLTGDQFCNMMEENINLIIENLRISKSKSASKSLSLKSQLDSLIAQFSIYFEILNTIDYATGNLIHHETVNIQNFQTEITNKIKPIVDMNEFTKKIEDKISLLEQVKNILKNELDKFSEIQSLISFSLDKKEKEIIYSHSNNFINSNIKKPKDSIVVTLDTLEQKNLINNFSFSPTTYFLSTQERISLYDKEEAMTYTYDPSKHIISIIQIPSISIYKFHCNKNEIPLSPSLGFYNNKIVITGGYSSRISQVVNTSFLLNLSCHKDQNPSTSIQIISPMLEPKKDHVLLFLNNSFIFSIGGINNEGFLLPNVEKLVNDPRPVKWIQSSNLPQPRKDYGACIYKEQFIYLIGGYRPLNDNNYFFNNILFFDLQKEVEGWKECAIIVNNWKDLSNQACFSIDSNKIILFGGNKVLSSKISPSNKCFEVLLHQGALKNIPLEINGNEGDYFLQKYEQVVRKGDNLYLIGQKHKLYIYSISDGCLSSREIDI